MDGLAFGLDPGNNRREIRVSYLGHVLVDTSSGSVSSTYLPPGSVNILGASTLVVASNVNRKGLIVFNDSYDEISLAWDVNAQVGKGIVLPPKSAYAFVGVENSIQALNAISSAGPSLLTYQEVE